MSIYKKIMYNYIYPILIVAILRHNVYNKNTFKCVFSLHILVWTSKEPSWSKMQITWSTYIILSFFSSKLLILGIHLVYQPKPGIKPIQLKFLYRKYSNSAHHCISSVLIIYKELSRRSLRWSYLVQILETNLLMYSSRSYWKTSVLFQV